MMIGSHSRFHVVTHQSQMTAVEYMVKHARAAAPGNLGSLHGLESGGSELTRKRFVTYDIEIAAQYQRSLNPTQRLQNKPALHGMILGVGVKHEQRKQMGIEYLQFTAAYRGFCPDQKAVGGRFCFAVEFKFDPRRWQIVFQSVVQRGPGKYGKPDTERQFTRVRFGIRKKTLIAWKRSTQAGAIGWRIGLHTPCLRLLNFLQQHDIRVMAADFGDGLFQIDRGMVGIGIIPCLPELHIELNDFKSFH